MRRGWLVLSGGMALTMSASLWSGRASAADPTNADCVTANEAALKLGNEHHLRADRNQLLVCSSSNCPSDIRLECVRRVDEVNAAIPTIIFEAKDGAGNDLSAVRVTMDGEVLAERLEGTALSIDPGEHTFVFETAGQPPLTKSFVIHESQKDRREPISFGSATPPPATEPLPVVPLPVVAETASGLGTQRILAIVAAGLGVVGVGVGTAFGVMAIAKRNDARNVCPNECANQSDANLWSNAKTTAQVSDVAFVVGGVGLAGGAVLWFTAKPRAAGGPSAQVGLGLGSVRLNGVW